jgi:tetratricopeptide (TPR) repeat protein
MKFWSRFLRRAVLIFTSGFIVVGAAYAQAQSAEETAADGYYTAKDWAKAAPAYESLAKANPKNAQDWYRLGVALAGNGQYQKAIESYDKAGSLGFHQFSVLFRTAKAYARLGDREKAFAKLDELLNIGYGPGDLFSADPDLMLLKDDPRFAKDIETADHNSFPCKYNAEHQQFDFWVGEWTVKQTGVDQVMGSSSIQKILDDCVVLENWTGGRGNTGKSFNIYDANTKKWEQYWVDSNGGRIFFSGHLNGTTMDYFADTDENGKKATRHLQFFHVSSDEVRQFSQRSEDGGKTWSVEYDFTYFRKKAGD